MVGAEGVVEPAAADRAEGHADARGHDHAAEHRAHHLRAEIVAREDEVERHHAGIGHAEDDGEHVEVRQLAHVDVDVDGDRLEREAGDEHAADAEAVGGDAEQQPAEEARETLDAVDARGRERRGAADHGVADGVEDRAGMGGAAEEERAGEHGELRRAQRRPAGRLRRRGAAAAPRLGPGLRRARRGRGG